MVKFLIYILFVTGIVFLQNRLLHKSYNATSFVFLSDTGACHASVINNVVITAAHCIGKEYNKIGLLPNTTFNLKIIKADYENDIAFLKSDIPIPKEFQSKKSTKSYKGFAHIVFLNGTMPIYIEKTKNRCLFIGNVIPGDSGTPIIDNKNRIIAIVISVYLHPRTSETTPFGGCTNIY